MLRITPCIVGLTLAVNLTSLAVNLTTHPYCLLSLTSLAVNLTTRTWHMREKYYIYFPLLERVIIRYMEGKVTTMQSSSLDDANGKPPPTNNSQPINQPSDEDLLNAITGGAAWAMETLYQRYSRTLYSLAYRIVANQRVAEDLLHDVFLSLWDHALPPAPQAGAVRLRLVSLIHHRTIDYVRTAHASEPTGASIEEASRAEQASAIHAWDESEQSSQSVQVHKALLRLPIEQRMVIELAYFQGWKASEIAEQSHIPLGTVQSHMRLGLINLKQMSS